MTFEFWRRQTNAAQKFSISSEGLSAPVSGMKVVVKLNVLFFWTWWWCVCKCGVVCVCVCGFVCVELGFFFCVEKRMNDREEYWGEMKRSGEVSTEELGEFLQVVVVFFGFCFVLSPSEERMTMRV